MFISSPWLLRVQSPSAVFDHRTQNRRYQRRNHLLVCDYLTHVMSHCCVSGGNPMQYSTQGMLRQHLVLRGRLTFILLTLLRYQQNIVHIQSAEAVQPHQRGGVNVAVNPMGAQIPPGRKEESHEETVANRQITAIANRQGPLSPSGPIELCQGRLAFHPKHNMVVGHV